VTNVDIASDLPEQLSRRAIPGIADWPAVVILGFENMSSDRGQDNFCGGMAEEILTALSKIEWLSVITLGSPVAYKPQAVRIQNIADELGVRYVVEGSVRSIGARVRVTARLTDAALGQTMWAERYDQDLTNPSAFREISTAVAAAMERQIFLANGFSPIV
jgi:TolB-like protein